MMEDRALGGGYGVSDQAGILAKAAWQAKSEGERLRHSMVLLKVTGRNRQLTRRVLVVTDRTLCDVQLKGEKLSIMHRVQLEHLSGYSMCPTGGSQAFVVHIDRRKDAAKDFLLLSSAREQAMAAVVAAYADRARRQLRRVGWDANSTGSQVLARLAQQQAQQLQHQEQLQQELLASQGAEKSEGLAPDGFDSADGFIAPRTEVLSAKIREFSASEWTAEVCDSYAREQFITQRTENVLENMQELGHLKAHAASQLQQSVVEHYRTFIRTSNETAEVDEDLSHLRKQLTSLKNTISALRETSFDFTEDGGPEQDESRHNSERIRTWETALHQPAPLNDDNGSKRVPALPAEPGNGRVERVLSMLMRAATPELSTAADANTLRQLLTTAQVKEYREGDTIVREGDAAQTFFIVEDGDCILQRRVHSVSSSGTITLQRGCCFGATSLREDTIDAKSDETVTAVSGACRCLHLSSTQFSTLAAAASEASSSGTLSSQPAETLIELDVLIAERKLRAAVQSVEEIECSIARLDGHHSSAEMLNIEPSARATLLTLTGLLHAARIRAALRLRIDRLHSVILRELSLPARVTRSTEQTQRLLKLLVRLGPQYIRQARTIFFHSQNLEIKSALQQQRFEGDIGAYVRAISQALFSALRRAIEKYRGLFAASEHACQNGMISGLVVWVVQRQIGDFCALLRRHIALTSDLQVVSECLGAAFAQCQQLEASGFQLGPQLRQLMCGDAAASIASCHATLSASLHAAVQGEDWAIERFHDDGDSVFRVCSDATREDEDVICMTESCRLMHGLMSRFMADLLPLHRREIDGDNAGCCGFSLQLYTPVISAVVSLLETYVSELDASKDACADQTSAMLSVVANMSAIVEGLLPRLVAHFTAEFDRPCLKLEQLRVHFSQVLESSFTSYCAGIVSTTMSKQLAAQRVSEVYTKLAESRGVPAPNPSEVVRRTAGQLLSVNIHAKLRLSPATHREVVFHIWGACGRHVATGVLAAANGSKDLKAAFRALTPEGRSQLALDVHFMIKLFDLCHSSQSTDSAHRPSEWHELEVLVGATAASEGAAENAVEDAEHLWKLLASI